MTMKAGWIVAALMGALASGGCKKPEPKSGEEVVAEADVEGEAVSSSI